MKRILIIDDDTTICLMLQSLLRRNQYEADIVFSANEAVKQLGALKYDLILSDFRLPDLDGIKLLQKIKTIDQYVPVIIMTSYADIRTAVSAIKMGAYEYVTKPLNTDEILLHIKSASSRTVNVEQKRTVTAYKPFVDFIQGKDTASAQIDKYISLVAPTDMSVIIEGESGTGKEIAARRIHDASNRKQYPFVAVDCGALSNELAGSELFGHTKGSFTGAISDKEGQFEAAKGGTLFLDEIGNLSYEVQIKLLRALQERKIRRIGSNKDIDVDVRILVASNEDLSVAVEKGTFREDLFHRLNEFKITIPALRERKDDIELFANYFLKLSNRELNRNILTISSRVIEKFKTYSWPGNLRQLRNIIRRSVLLSKGSVLEENSLPTEIINCEIEEKLSNDSTNLKLVQAVNEKQLIIETLRKVNFNKSKAARLLNIDRKTLYNKIKQYDIEL